MTQSDSYHPPRVDSDSDTAGSVTEAAPETALPGLSSGRLRYHLLPQLKTQTDTTHGVQTHKTRVGLEIGVTKADWTQYRDGLLQDWEREHRSAFGAFGERTGTKEDRAQLLQTLQCRLEEITDLHDRGLDVPRRVIWDDLFKLVKLVGTATREVSEDESHAWTVSELARFSRIFKCLKEESVTLDQAQYILHESRDTFTEATRGGQKIDPHYGQGANEYVVTVEDLGNPQSADTGTRRERTTAVFQLFGEAEEPTIGEQRFGEKLNTKVEEMHAELWPNEGRAYPPGNSDWAAWLGYQTLEMAMSPGQLAEVCTARAQGQNEANEARTQVVSREVSRILKSCNVPSSAMTIRFVPAGTPKKVEFDVMSLIVPPTEE